MADRPQPVTAYVSAGSNVEPEDNLPAALDMLKAAAGVRVTGVSTVWRTRAIGRPEDPDFLNCVLRILTDLPPDELKRKVLAPIEVALGRRRGADKYAARKIDLDLLLWGRVIMDDGGVALPHPDLRRWFVAAGVAELAGELSGEDPAGWPDECRHLLDEGLAARPAGPTGEIDNEMTDLLRRRLER
jgi:2-amino-4-hydroxy-6-hydroxymethyldihydropteridine diphosphokinase